MFALARATLAGPSSNRASSRERAKDALRASIAYGSSPDVIERRVRALELERDGCVGDASSSSSVVSRSRGTWRVTHTTAPPPSNGRLGPLVGESFQVIESEGARYRNVLSVPPNSWLAVTLRARYEVLDAEDASEDEVGRTWKVFFEDVGVRVFDRFEPVRKTFESEKTTRIWRTTYVDEGVRVVRAARTMEALDSERARGRNAKAGDEDDCLFVMTREVPWWELPAWRVYFFQCRNLCIRTNVSFSPLTPTSRATRTMSTRASPSPRRRCARARARGVPIPRATARF